MKLHEDINRIKEVMGINESKAHKSVEMVLNNIIDHLKILCNELGFGSDDEFKQLCELIDSDFKISVNRIETIKLQIASATEIYVDISYHNVFNWDTDVLMYELNYHIKKWMGDYVFVRENKIVNQYKENNPQW